MRGHPFHALLALVLFSCQAAADDEGGGRSLAGLLDELNQQGQRIIYSSRIVSDDMRVPAGAPEDRSSLEALLAGYGLGLRDGPGDSLLVVRLDPVPGAAAAADAVIEEPALPEITVTSSLHRLTTGTTGSHTYLDRELATRIPTLAGDALRLTDRLPGTASGGLSTRNHVRGGEVNEVLFLIDGLRLYEPYHMKDFQAIATIVNANAVAGMDVYTGGFPVRYGDRMSGVTSLSLREAAADLETELALSLFNTSVLASGSFGSQRQGDWLATYRRGNLDLLIDLIDPEIGDPTYQDALLHVGWEFGPRARLSARLLASHDKIGINDSFTGEDAAAKYDNRVFWLKLESSWSDALESQAIAAVTVIDNTRNGIIDNPGVVSGFVTDERSFTASELRQDWQWHLSRRVHVDFGYSYRWLDAEYAYVSERQVFAPFDELFDNTPVTARSSTLDPGGSQAAAYAELRWQPRDGLTLDAGLRWDQQTYTTSDNDDQTSPRFSLLWQAGDDTEIRLGWGQFYQSQEINELQISDGVEAFFPAQRSEHRIASLTRHIGADYALKLSVYEKKFRTLRPRFENVFDTLVLIPELQIDRLRIDAQSALARGAELQLMRGDGNDDELFWWLSYTLSEVVDRIDGREVLRSWDQRHALKGGISWRWRDWNISVAGTVHSGWPKTELDVLYTPNPGAPDSVSVTSTPRNATRFPAFHTLDLRVSRDFRLARSELTTFFEVSNVYNRRNPCCFEYSFREDADGNPVVDGRRAHWLPAVPNIGVVWRF